ncbi:MAG: hypothetical protein JWO38_5733 [Gemmataceae bacterium]|nr:hypothetical protein [Gemmataceae bacterium]
MSDIAEMRFRLQQVASYRELCRAVQRTGRENVFFALLMLFLAYNSHQNGQAVWVLALYAILALAELAVGLFKWVFPSAEGVLLDALVWLLFAGWNLGWQALGLVAGVQPQLLVVFLGVYMLYGAVRRFRDYGQLRRLFAERPTSAQVAWFNDLVHEIRTADPELDDQALDLPTRPYWRAKLLGPTAFFVSVRGESVLVAGPDDFGLVLDRKDERTGRSRVLLRLYDRIFPDFEIDEASWGNYRKWVVANPIPRG